MTRVVAAVVEVELLAVGAKLGPTPTVAPTARLAEVSYAAPTRQLPTAMASRHVFHAANATRSVWMGLCATTSAAVAAPDFCAGMACGKKKVMEEASVGW